MAITDAQQAKQIMMKKGGPVVQAGVKNYKPSKMVTVPKVAKSSPTHPTAKLAYITDAEKKLLIKKNLHGSLKGKPNRGPGGIPSLQGDFGPGGKGSYSGGGADFGGAGGDYSGARDTGTGNYVASNPDVSIQRQREFRAQQLNKSKEAQARRKAAAKFQKEKETRDLIKKQEAEKVMDRRKKMGMKSLIDLYDLPADYDEEKDDTAAMLDLFINDPYRTDRTKRTLPTPTGLAINLLEKPLFICYS